jgi:hypothetical protein
MGAKPKLQITKEIDSFSVHKYLIFLMNKAAQGFSVRCTCCTPQPETRGERRSSEKESFMN